MKKVVFLFLFIISAFILGAQDFRFALLTDLHVRSNDTSAFYDLKRSVEEINRTPGLSFVLVTGDLTEEGDRSSLLRVKAELDRLKVKYYALSGNHETKWSESGATDFGHIFGSERFDFEQDGIRFLGFGTGPVIRMMDGHVAPQDIRWLKETLAEKPEQPVVLVTHYPLLPGDVDNWYEVTDAVRKYKIKAVLGGHYHSNRLFFYDGIPGFINRSNLRNEPDNLSGYSLYEITPDSILVSEKRIGQEPIRWGGYSLKHTYYTEDNASYPRPDYSDNRTYPKVREIWSTKTENALYASPIVYNKAVYIGDDAGFFACYSLKDGRERWRFSSGNRIVGTAAAEDQTVVFGSADKLIYALDTRSGKLKWKFEAKEPVLGAATIHKGVVYIGASDGTFRALDLKTGKLKWEYAGIKGYIETRPLVYDGKVIFGAWDNRMYALNLEDGRLCWQWDGGLTRMHFSPAAVWPVAARGKVFFTAPDRVMTALDAQTGEALWRTKESMVRETIGLSADSSRIYSKTMQDSVVCYSTESTEARRIWSVNVGYGYDHAASMPVEKDGTVFGSTKNGVIFALEGKTGRLLWKHKVGNSLIGTVVPLNGQECIYVSSEGIVGRLRQEK